MKIFNDFDRMINWVRIVFDLDVEPVRWYWQQMLSEDSSV